MPEDTRMRPPSRRVRTTAAAYEKISGAKKAVMRHIRAATSEITPSHSESFSGAVENAIIPSKAYFISFLKPHFD